MCVLWWIKWRWDRQFSKYIGFPLPASFHQSFMLSHSAITDSLQSLQLTALLNKTLYCSTKNMLLNYRVCTLVSKLLPAFPSAPQCDSCHPFGTCGEAVLLLHVVKYYWNVHICRDLKIKTKISSIIVLYSFVIVLIGLLAC